MTGFRKNTRLIVKVGLWVGILVPAECLLQLQEDSKNGSSVVADNSIADISLPEPARSQRVKFLPSPLQAKRSQRIRPEPQPSKSSQPTPTLQRFFAKQRHMGVDFKITLYSTSETFANHAFQLAYQRISQLDKTLTHYGGDSELLQLCASSPHTQPVHVSHDLWCVLKQALRVSHESHGAFDVTVGPLTKLWRRARRNQQLPETAQLEAARKAVGYWLIELDCSQPAVRLTQPGMLLDLSAVAKGYAADQALVTMKKNGVTCAAVDAGGDLALGQPPPGHSGWRVALPSPNDKIGAKWMLEIAQCGIATSGDRFQLIELDGRRYSHILDPRSGKPLEKRHQVTVIAKNCARADSLASALCVLDLHRGMRLLNRLPTASGRIIGNDGVAKNSQRFPSLQPIVHDGVQR